MEGTMRLVRRIVPLAGIVLVSVAIVTACSDPGQATRPAIPTINAQTAGTVYCAEWSCSYDFCHLRPDWNGYSCCVEKTLEPGSAAPRPSCVSSPGNGSSCGNYWLDGGTQAGSLDDSWYCDVSNSCCTGGSGDPHYYGNPGGGTANPNCPPGGTSCDAPPPPGPNPP